MPQIFYPNLAFEEELETERPQLSAVASRAVAELAPVLGLLSNPNAVEDAQPDSSDIVLVQSDLMPEGLPPALSRCRFESLESLYPKKLEGYSYQPWGWSLAAIRLGQQLIPDLEFPDSAIVRHINSRRFHSEFDQRMAFSSSSEPHEVSAGILCTSQSEVFAALEFFAGQSFSRWVIKSNFSQAARNRLLGQGQVLDTSQKDWLAKRFHLGEPVYAEPWYECIAECGLQFTIPPPSESYSAVQAVQFEGASEMLTTPTGRYKGSVIRQSPESMWWAAAVDRCQIIAQRARSLGFFGPIGMDCMLMRIPADGRLWLRPCHDINGRFTMGRVALSLKRWMQPGETGFWCHTFSDSASSRQNVFDSLKVENVRIVPTSSSMIGAHSTNLQTALLISDDCEQLIQVARKILSQDIRGPITDIQTK